MLLRSRDVRTSQGTFMSREMDPDGVLAWVEDKISVLTGIPTYHGEVLAAAASPPPPTPLLLPLSCSPRYVVKDHAFGNSSTQTSDESYQLESWHHESLLSPAAQPEGESHK